MSRATASESRKMRASRSMPMRSSRSPVPRIPARASPRSCSTAATCSRARRRKRLPSSATGSFPAGRAAAREAHARAAQELHAAGERARAREVADAWLRREPACEALHRLLMTWLPSDEALAQYETYRRARAVLHGAAPSDEMAAHADRLRRGAERALREPPARLGAATSFMGRTDELSELRTLLADPACRLLTVHGLGGVGKTRLANAIVELERPSFGGGGHVAALESL